MTYLLYLLMQIYKVELYRLLFFDSVCLFNLESVLRVYLEHEYTLD